MGLQANASFTPAEALCALRRLPSGSTGALHLGYPHLLQHFQGQALRAFLSEARGVLGDVVVSVDLNGVTSASGGPGGETILTPALPLVDILHLNEHEAHILTGADVESGGVGTTPPPLAMLQQAAGVLHAKGVAIVALTLGAAGAYVCVSGEEGRVGAGALGRQAKAWRGQGVLLPAYPVEKGAAVNTNGAGDAFIAGLVGAVLVKEPLGLEQAVRLGLLAARERVDGSRRESQSPARFAQLIDLAKA